MSKTYSTNEIAKILNIHHNTVRWYDDIGMITPVPRTPNGYRKFDDNHLRELRIVRVIFNGKYTSTKIRNTAFAVLTALKEKGKDEAITKVKEYRKHLEKEYAAAHKAVKILYKWMKGGFALKDKGGLLTRKEAAERLGITTEVLRNWERNNLIVAPRTGKKNERVYGEKEIMRMYIIYMLRQNNYGIAAIHSSLTLFDKGDLRGAAIALNSPVDERDKTYLLACDHWLEVLKDLLADADEMMGILVD